MQSISTTPLAADSGMRRAHWMLRLVCLLTLFTVVVGRAWDGYWHITYVFDSFWSPPHVFVYTMSTISGLLAAYTTLRPKLSRYFGARVWFPLIPFALPGALFLLCSGFVALGVAGMILDNLWHTAFGLDETAWSLPHAMIGTSLTSVVFGAVASRLALRHGRPLGWRSLLFFGFLLVAVSPIFLGPLHDNNTPDMVRALARIPTLTVQVGAQRAAAVTLYWNLTRTNPALIVLGPLWFGLALALVRGLDQRAMRVLAVVVVWRLLSDQRGTAEWLDQFLPVARNAANWQPLPLLPATLVLLVCERLGFGERLAWAASGVSFALLVHVTWGTHLWALALVPFAAPTTLIGVALGKWIWATLQQPTAYHTWALVLGTNVGLPVLTGIVDLYLRTHLGGF